ncbi:threonine--tRNA ligase [Patescibacteria group bacterium AH-259-L05]|nr:threonine--tRNA ligase [Patescibacteria group bacterium AH-259-L05]
MTKIQYPLDALRHSTSHLMAAAILDLFPQAKFGVGPATENGFYYDIDIGRTITPADLKNIEKKMKELKRRNLKYKRDEITIDTAIKLFTRLNQKYKVELLNDIKKYGSTEIDARESGLSKSGSDNVSIYTLGDFTDLCRGPHVNTTRDIGVYKLLKIAGAYWRGTEKNKMLQRIYGVAYSKQSELDTFLKLQIEIEKRDHRKLGKELDLFSFHDVSPGAPFIHPKGMVIFKELEQYWREIHEKAGYQETSTPIMVKDSVFSQSGHLKHYRENMFGLMVEKEQYFLKPMNCPESTFIYRTHMRSYKDLPLRLSEIGKLHRNELSGVLGGMFRVRQLTMDDAHIYATLDQLQTEISGILKLIKLFYALFKFKPTLYLATRPDDAMGDPKLWKKAEKSLKYALKKNNIDYELKLKDGSFYGPKIDVHIKDALSRDWQLATIQLDFQMPERFDLKYIDNKGKKQRPIMIHRAIFGSFERFIGILIEHYAGLFPVWLSPIQVYITSVGSAHENPAKKLRQELENNGIRVWLDTLNETISYKVRKAEKQKIPYILVIGDKEVKGKTLNVRMRGNKVERMNRKKFIDKLLDEVKNKK